MNLLFLCAETGQMAGIIGGIAGGIIALIFSVSRKSKNPAYPNANLKIANPFTDITRNSNSMMEVAGICKDAGFDGERIPRDGDFLLLKDNTVGRLWYKIGDDYLIMPLEQTEFSLKYPDPANGLCNKNNILLPQEEIAGVININFTEDPFYSTKRLPDIISADKITRDTVVQNIGFKAAFSFWGDGDCDILFGKTRTVVNTGYANEILIFDFADGDFCKIIKPKGYSVVSGNSYIDDAESIEIFSAAEKSSTLYEKTNGDNIKILKNGNTSFVPSTGFKAVIILGYSEPLGL